MNYQPVFIIGAPRSGTNILRDCLSVSAALATWPCDEINYIWKYGNAKYPTDELKVEQLTPKIRTYIRRQFDKLATHEESRFVLEKTCANCLRVDYLNAIFPNAKYIYIYRDGVDCTASAVKRWKAEFDLEYTLKKVRFVPLGDLPYYFYKFVRNRIFKMLSKEKRLAYWGPNFDGMEELLKVNDSTIISAHQWAKCNSLSLESFSRIESDNVHFINYRQLAEDPQAVINNIIAYLGLTDQESRPILDYAEKNVRKSSVGKGYREISGAHMPKVREITGTAMKKLNLQYLDEQ